ncbi:MAG: outer membrane beta-barrel protein [Bacteroidota bacterium]
MRAPLIFMSCILFSFPSFARDSPLRGRVVDEKNTPLPGVHVRLVTILDTSTAIFATSGLDGSFQIPDLSSGSYRLDITAIGHRSIQQVVRVQGRAIDLGTIVLAESPIQLGEVLIERRPPAAVLNGDTTEFLAASVKVNRDATAEDMLTKLPGITVSNGTVSQGGENVQRVLVDGKPFFGDDPTLALRNLPAEVVDKIQVFDQMSDQAQFTGFDDGQSVKALNIITRRRGRDLNFGKVATGYGDNQRYEVGGNVHLFDGDRRISVLGLSNNVNDQNFSMQDILGVISSNNQMRTPGMGPRGRGPGGGGGFRQASPFGRSGAGGNPSSLVGQQQGINTTSMFGTNYSDSLASNLFMQSSYFFNRIDNTNEQLDRRQYLLGGDSIGLYHQTSNADGKNFNHRINSRIEYAPDPSDVLTVLPQLYFQSNRSSNMLDAITALNSTTSLSQSATDASNSGYNLSGHVVYRHKFDLPGRTISLDVGMAANRKVSVGLLSASDQYEGTSGINDSLAQRSDYLSNVNTVSANIVYTEPVSVDDLVELLYTPSLTKSTADKNTLDLDRLVGMYSIPNAALSNAYANNYLTQSAGVGYRWRGTGMNLMTNLSYQVAQLRSDNILPGADLSKRFGSFLPSALFISSMADHRTLRIFYRTSTQSPSVTQLQQVVDNSNPLLVTTGNPDLIQSYTHSLLARYALTSADRVHSMFLLLAGTYTSHYVANATLIPSRDTLLAGGTVVPVGSQLTYPVNLNGYWNVRSFFTYGLPFSLLGSTLNLNSGVTFSRTPALLNAVRSTGNSVAFTEGFVLGSNLSEDFDFTISYSGNYTLSRNSQQANANSNSYSHTASLRWVWTFWNGFVLRNDVTNALTNGLAEGFNQNSVLWNISLGKKLFAEERGEIKMGVTDLLGQNKSVNRSVTGTYIDDTSNEVLTRYFLVTFTYTLR